MGNPRVLSISQVTCYLGCPLKYRFQYVDKIPRPWRVAAMAFGTSVHAAVEWFHRQRMNGGEPDAISVIKQFDADWYAQNLEPLVFPERDSCEGLAEKGRAMLELYVQSQGTAKPLAVEQPFELELRDPESGELLEVFLRGVIDLVEDGDILVDLKTASRNLEAGGLERHLQLSTYALVYFLQTEGTIPRLRLDMLLKTKQPRLERHETTRSLADLSWTAKLLQDVAYAIETEHFYPNPSWRCSECEYFAHCQQWRGTWSPQEDFVQISDGEGAGEIAGA
jgi:putative RecB family exonuclease